MKLARMIVLAVAVAAGGVAALLANKSERPVESVIVQSPAQMELVEILVAQNEVPIGRVITQQDLRWQAWPVSAAGPDFIRNAGASTSLSDVVGSITRTPFSSGEPIRESKLIKAGGSGYLAAILPSGMRAASFEISQESSVAGFILPNDRVDVLLTRAEKTNGEEIYRSETILSNIRVLAIDQTLEEKKNQRTVIGKIATVEVSPVQTETLAVARRLGSLSLVLRSLAEPNEATLGPSPNVLGARETINVVRFGSSAPVLK
jgi:pilus assembly protein CpaB